jgi:REP element-mobilizing transposase RayT
MTEGACILSLDQRAAVESQITETCDVRKWILHAVNCRTNHLHVVVTAIGIEPAKVRKDLKAWTTRRLRNEFDSARQNWWAERGSIRHIFDEAGLEATILYTIDGQSGPHGPTAPKPP